MTQVTLGVRDGDFVDLDIDQLAGAFLMFRKKLLAARDQLPALKYEFHIRMKGKRGCPSPTF